jgi:hypothetical protein
VTHHKKIVSRLNHIGESHKEQTVDAHSCTVGGDGNDNNRYLINYLSRSGEENVEQLIKITWNKSSPPVMFGEINSGAFLVSANPCKKKR